MIGAKHFMNDVPDPVLLAVRPGDEDFSSGGLFLVALLVRQGLDLSRKSLSLHEANGMDGTLSSCPNVPAHERWRVSKLICVLYRPALYRHSSKALNPSIWNFCVNTIDMGVGRPIRH